MIIEDLPDYIHTKWRDEGCVELKFLDTAKKQLKIGSDISNGDCKEPSAGAFLVQCYFSNFHVWEYDDQSKPKRDRTKEVPISQELSVAPPTIRNIVWKNWYEHWKIWWRTYVALPWVRQYPQFCSASLKRWYEKFLAEYPELESYLNYCLHVPLNSDQMLQKLGLTIDQQSNDCIITKKMKRITRKEINLLVQSLQQEFYCLRYWVHFRLYLRDMLIKMNDELEYFFASKGVHDSPPSIEELRLLYPDRCHSTTAFPSLIPDIISCGANYDDKTFCCHILAYAPNGTVGNAEAGHSFRQLEQIALTDQFIKSFQISDQIDKLWNPILSSGVSLGSYMKSNKIINNILDELQKKDSQLEDTIKNYGASCEDSEMDDLIEREGKLDNWDSSDDLQKYMKLRLGNRHQSEITHNVSLGATELIIPQNYTNANKFENLSDGLIFQTEDKLENKSPHVVRSKGDDSHNSDNFEIISIEEVEAANTAPILSEEIASKLDSEFCFKQNITLAYEMNAEEICNQPTSPNDIDVHHKDHRFGNDTCIETVNIINCRTNSDKSIYDIRVSYENCISKPGDNLSTRSEKNERESTDSTDYVGHSNENEPAHNTDLKYEEQIPADMKNIAYEKIQSDSTKDDTECGRSGTKVQHTENIRPIDLEMVTVTQSSSSLDLDFVETNAIEINNSHLPEQANNSEYHNADVGVIADLSVKTKTGETKKKKKTSGGIAAGGVGWALKYLQQQQQQKAAFENQLKQAEQVEQSTVRNIENNIPAYHITQSQLSVSGDDQHQISAYDAHCHQNEFTVPVAKQRQEASCSNTDSLPQLYNGNQSQQAAYGHSSQNGSLDCSNSAIITEQLNQPLVHDAEDQNLQREDYAGDQVLSEQNQHRKYHDDDFSQGAIFNVKKNFQHVAYIGDDSHQELYDSDISHRANYDSTSYQSSYCDDFSLEATSSDGDSYHADYYDDESLQVCSFDDQNKQVPFENEDAESNQAILRDSENQVVRKRKHKKNAQLASVNENSGPDPATLRPKKQKTLFQSLNCFLRDSFNLLLEILLNVLMFLGRPFLTKLDQEVGLHGTKLTEEYTRRLKNIRIETKALQNFRKKYNRVVGMLPDTPVLREHSDIIVSKVVNRNWYDFDRGSNDSLINIALTPWKNSECEEEKYVSDCYKHYEHKIFATAFKENKFFPNDLTNGNLAKFFAIYISCLAEDDMRYLLESERNKEAGTVIDPLVDADPKPFKCYGKERTPEWVNNGHFEQIDHTEATMLTTFSSLRTKTEETLDKGPTLLEMTASSKVEFDEYGNPVETEWHEDGKKIENMSKEELIWEFIKNCTRRQLGARQEDDKYIPLHVPETVVNYWYQRHRLFLRYNEGILLDEESWYSVTPEIIACHQAERLSCDTVIDAFCGAGGNSIQLAFFCKTVIAIDIDPRKIALARHNAKVYGVDDRIKFMLGDFFKLAPKLKADVVYLSPPWGGIHYNKKESYDVFKLDGKLDCKVLFQVARNITPNVALYLPKSSNIFQVAYLAGPDGKVDLEYSQISGKRKGLTAYFGDLVDYYFHYDYDEGEDYNNDCEGEDYNNDCDSEGGKDVDEKDVYSSELK